MERKLPIKKKDKFIWIVDIIASVAAPFSSLRKKERETLAEIYKLNDELKSIPEEQRNLLIFHKDNRKKIADNIGISVDNLYNIIMTLRKKGILTEVGIEPKYVINNTDSITFKFIEVD